MNCLDADTVALFTKRAYDIAACVDGIKVFLNGKRIQVDNLLLSTLYIYIYTQSTPMLYNALVLQMLTYILPSLIGQQLQELHRNVH